MKNKKSEVKVEESNNEELNMEIEDKPAPIQDDSMIIKLTHEENENPFGEVIEKERHGLFALYRRTNKFNTFIMIIVVAIFVAAFIMMGQPGWGPIVCWVLVGATLAGLVVYYIFTRKLYPNASKNYFKVFWTATNNYLFSSPDFQECKIDTNEKYVLSDVISDRVYKNVIDSASRNIVRGKYKQQEFAFGELAFYRPGAKRNSREVIFVGRHLSIDNKLHFEGRYVVNIRNETGADKPNDIDDLVPLISQNLFTVYGPEGANAEKDIGKDTLDALQAIECVGSLVNVNVVFWPGHTAAYLSYDDEIVAIPFEKEINVEAYKQLKQNIEYIFDVLGEKK